MAEGIPEDRLDKFARTAGRSADLRTWRDESNDELRYFIGRSRDTDASPGRAFQLLMSTSRVTLISGKKRRDVSHRQQSAQDIMGNVGREQRGERERKNESRQERPGTHTSTCGFI